MGTASGKLIHVGEKTISGYECRVSLFSPFLSPSPFFSWLEAFPLSLSLCLLMVKSEVQHTGPTS